MAKKKKVNWEKVLTESWVSNHKNLPLEELEKAVIDAELQLKHLKIEKESNDNLKAAQEIVKDLNSGFTAAAKYEQSKIEFLIEQIEDKRRVQTKVN